MTFKGPTGYELKVEGTYCKFSDIFEEGPEDGGSAFGNVCDICRSRPTNSIYPVYLQCKQGIGL